MELTELSLLDQDKLVNLINKATVYLDRRHYPLTHLYVNALTAEPEYIDENDAWTQKTPVAAIDPLKESHWWNASK